MLIVAAVVIWLCLVGFALALVKGIPERRNPKDTK